MDQRGHDLSDVQPALVKAGFTSRQAGLLLDGIRKILTARNLDWQLSRVYGFELTGEQNRAILDLLGHIRKLPNEFEMLVERQTRDLNAAQANDGDQRSSSRSHATVPPVAE